MRRDGSTLFCDFQSSDTKSTVTIELGQEIRVDWATLRT
jgi:hypothetical protein